MKTNFFRPIVASLPLLLALFGPLCASAQCRDPWINQAYRELGRTPVGTYEAGVCNIHLYNNGTWRSYPELKGYVQQFLGSGVTVGYETLSNGNSILAVKAPNGLIGVSLLNSSGNIVAQGGGNIVAQGGGNIVGQGGLNLVNTNGSNIGPITTQTAGMQFSSGYSLQSGEQARVKTSGNGSIVIR